MVGGGSSTDWSSIHPNPGYLQLSTFYILSTIGSHGNEWLGFICSQVIRIAVRISLQRAGVSHGSDDDFRLGQRLNISKTAAT